MSLLRVGDSGIPPNPAYRAPQRAGLIGQMDVPPRQAARAQRQAARGLLARRHSARLAIHRLALERADRRLYEVPKDDPRPPAGLISPSVADILRLRREQQELRDRLARAGRRRAYRS